MVSVLVTCTLMNSINYYSQLVVVSSRLASGNTVAQTHKLLHSSLTTWALHPKKVSESFQNRRLTPKLTKLKDLLEWITKASSNTFRLDYQIGLVNSKMIYTHLSNQIPFHLIMLSGRQVLTNQLSQCSCTRAWRTSSCNLRKNLLSLLKLSQKVLSQSKKHP
jgi:hypothetical protein